MMHAWVGSRLHIDYGWSRFFDPAEACSPSRDAFLNPREVNLKNCVFRTGLNWRFGRLPSWPSTDRSIEETPHSFRERLDVSARSIAAPDTPGLPGAPQATFLHRRAGACWCFPRFVGPSASTVGPSCGRRGSCRSCAAGLAGRRRLAGGKSGSEMHDLIDVESANVRPRAIAVNHRGGTSAPGCTTLHRE